MYYTLINDITSNFESTLNEPTNFPDDMFDFISGTFISNELELPLVFTTDAKKNEPMVDFSKGSVTLMSRRFLKVLENAGVDNLQVFPAIVKSEADGTVWKDYFAVNVLGMVSCVNLDKSKYSEIMPGHYRFKELAIDSAKTNDALLFRLHEHCPTIIVHTSVLRHIVESDPEDLLLGWESGDIIQG